MKKLLVVSMLTVASSIVFMNGGLATPLHAGAWGQAQDVEGTSGYAAGSANSGNYEGAREGAGAGFDGNSYNSPSVVDLSGKQGVVDPNDLKKYDPPQPSLKPSYVPPLP